jgi:hypothetical protein
MAKKIKFKKVKAKAQKIVGDGSITDDDGLDGTGSPGVKNRPPAQ